MNQAELDISLIRASKVGNVEKVRELLQVRSTCGFSANVHAYDDEALLWAADFGHTETVQVLLQAGANVHAKNNEALIHAADRGYTEIVQLLLQAGANVHAENDFAVRLAAFMCKTATVQVLLQAGANVHAEDDSALRDAAWMGTKATVQVLLQAGANSSKISLSQLKASLTPKFLLSLSYDVLLGMENNHQELKEKYQYSDKKKILQEVSKGEVFEFKINFADLYYRPGGQGWYLAISF